MRNLNKVDHETYSITLAAGAGSRMPTDMPPKPCCRIGPLSVIQNALETYERAGVPRHCVVVGHRAAELMGEVCRKRNDVLFAFQGEQRGTGDAVRCALEFLATIARPELVLITTGDKVIEPPVIRGALETQRATGCDLCVSVMHRRHHPVGGRIVMCEGRPQAIIEVPDIRVRELAARLQSLPPGERPATVIELRRLCSEHVPDEGKLARCFPALGTLLRGEPDEPLAWKRIAEAAATMPPFFEADGRRISLQQAAQAEMGNLSVYVGRFDPLLEAVRRIGTGNVQGECYFTDVVAVLASSGRSVELFRVREPRDVMAFNTWDQLEQVRTVHAERARQRNVYPALGSWAGYFASRPGHQTHVDAVGKLAEQIGPERPCIVVSTPGRVNLMGRHIDHQGGVCNLMAIDRELVIAASPREDDRINVWNADATSYPYRSFTFAELTADIVWEDWLRTLRSQYVQRVVSRSMGDWANYVKGAALRLQHRFRDRKLKGMDALVCSSIPVGAGLSASSALVMAASEALTELNALNVRPPELVDLCGEAEWFVGDQAATADHAAIKFGGPGEVISVSFFPFEIVGRHPFPDDYRLLVCHSGLWARQIEDASERFRATVACYHMAREIIKDEFPQFEPLIEHLRDVTTDRLDISLPALYHLIGRLPERLDPARVEELALRHSTVARCVSDLDVGACEFPVRDAALYGLAECARALRAGPLLDRRDTAALGHMMNVSHDGDRRATWNGGPAPFESHATDERMRSLIERAGRLDPLAQSGAALWQQPGSYGCSLPEIDRMVDLALACEGVLGAQLSGAGLGGGIMVLARGDAVEGVRGALETGYYAPEGIEPREFVCRASQGSQVRTTVEG